MGESLAYQWPGVHLVIVSTRQDPGYQFESGSHTLPDHLSLFSACRAMLPSAATYWSQSYPYQLTTKSRKLYTHILAKYTFLKVDTLWNDTMLGHKKDGKLQTNRGLWKDLERRTNCETLFLVSLNIHPTFMLGFPPLPPENIITSSPTEKKSGVSQHRIIK